MRDTGGAYLLRVFGRLAIVILSFFATLWVLDRRDIPTANQNKTTTDKSPIVIRAADLVRGVSVEVGGIKSLGATVLHNGQAGRANLPNQAEYEFICSQAGRYRLEIEYAALSNRPAQISINGAVVLEQGLNGVTGGWEENFQRWMPQGEVQLQEGKNVLEIKSTSMFPHIRTIQFIRIS
jgi:hypothetical protein